jgi:hypothetical protein
MGQEQGCFNLGIAAPTTPINIQETKSALKGGWVILDQNKYYTHSPSYESPATPARSSLVQDHDQYTVLVQFNSTQPSKMKLSIVSVALLSSVVLAAPAPAADPEAFPISELLTSDLSIEEHALSKRQYSSSSYNQLTDGTACRPITVIYARGTLQAGNVGDSRAVGPLFFNNLASKVGGTSKLAIQGVTYSASINGFSQGGDPAGSTTMATLINTVSQDWFQ